jgi:ribosome-binding protein aMBF1 (putative translation factor)
MITNERQYRITKAEVKRFEHAITSGREQETHLHPRLQQAIRESLESQIAELREELAEYEALRSGHVTVLELDSLAAIPDALIRARAVAGLTQKELATRLGMKEQQVQRYEATRYVGVSLARMQAVADALGVTIHERVTLPIRRGVG